MIAAMLCVNTSGLKSTSLEIEAPEKVAGIQTPFIEWVDVDKKKALRVP